MKTKIASDYDIAHYQEATVSEPKLIWRDASDHPFTVYGLYQPAIYNKQEGKKPEYIRMPEKAAQKINSDISWLYRNTSGGRVRFRTDSEYVALHFEYNTIYEYEHMSFTCSRGFDLYTLEDGKQHYFGTFEPPCKNGVWDFSGEFALHFGDQKMRELVINFPLYNNVDCLQIGLEETAQVEKTVGYRAPDPIVYYGHSITQGAVASRPGNCYQGFISRALDMDYVNLGFSGSARGESAMAAYVASLNMCAFVLDYNYNSNVDELRSRHFLFYKTVRDTHPEIPIVCMSHYSRSRHLTARELAESREIILQTVEQAQTQGDKNIRFLDGDNIHWDQEAGDTTVDSCHCSDWGFYKISQALLDILREFQL